MHFIEILPKSKLFSNLYFAKSMKANKTFSFTSIYYVCDAMFSVPTRVGRNNAVDDAIGPANARHKIVVMGSAKVGKTSIITQFLYNTFTTKYKRTIEEMHQGNFSIAGVSLTLDILDTAGSYEVSAFLFYFFNMLSDSLLIIITFRVPMSNLFKCNITQNIEMYYPLPGHSCIASIKSSNMHIITIHLPNR